MSLLDIFTQFIAAPYTTNVTALNRGTSIYLTNLLGMFDILTQQEIAKENPYICQGNFVNVKMNHCYIEIIKLLHRFCPNYSKLCQIITKN